MPQPTPINPKESYDQKPQVIKDIHYAIDEDEWMFGVIWGKPRTGKSNLSLKLGYEVYQEWDKVLGCVVFNLAGLLHNMHEGLPQRILTKNGKHNRVPYMIGDDWGANFNKARTQHEQAYDLLKGAWDTYGTKLAVIMVNMNRPDELTRQLTEKYTHEIYVPIRGVAKYDQIHWQPNYYGWDTRQSKTWIEEFKFGKVPEDIYREYDESRMALCDETYQLIQDAIANTETEKVIKRSDETDIELLETISLRGTVERSWFFKPENERIHERINRNKARGLIVSIRKSGTKSSYYYELTELGRTVLETITLSSTSPKDLKQQLRGAKYRVDESS